MTPAHTSGTCSSRTKAPSRLANIGATESPPPTQRSKPGPSSGWLTPTKETSLISWTTSMAGEPEMAVLNLRGRLENSGLPMYLFRICSMAQVPSTISSAAIPATGEPMITRGASPQASSVCSQPAPAAPRSRDVLDADPVQLDVLPVGDVRGVAAEVRADLADRAQLLGRQDAAVAADAHHEVFGVQFLGG
jgi:hypothetical protein